MDPFILNESTKQHTFTWKKGAGKIVEEVFEEKKVTRETLITPFRSNNDSVN